MPSPTDSNASDSSLTDALARLFQTSRPSRRKLRELSALAGALTSKRCLCVGGEPGIIPGALASRGEWEFAVLRPEAAESFAQFTGGRPAHVVDLSAPLVFPDASFDLVVLVDVLERIRDDNAFVQECHRVLKPGGSLVMATAHDKKGMLAPLRRLAGMSGDSSQLARPGYTQRSLYDLLKDGFDITEFQIYSKFWEQLADLIQQIAAGLFAGSSSPDLPPNQIRRIASVRAVASVFTSPLLLCGALFGWSQGYQIAARARARIWRVRREVKIRDGRSIAEAAIQTKIGTSIEY